MLHLFKETKIDFIGVRKYFYIFSGLLILLSCVMFVTRGVKLGVDFTGGSLVQVKFFGPRNTVQTEQVRAALDKLGAGNASIQKFGESNEFLIRTEKPGTFGGKKFSDTVIAVLRNEFKCDQASLAANPSGALCDSIARRMESTVGPRMGKELQSKAVWAVLLGFALILVYVSVRFDFRFGTTGVLALFHDLIIVVGVLSAFGREISIPVIAALLTIVGYDINDTIVVSDRIREDVRKMRKEKFSDVVNSAINKTLSRTVITSLTVFLISLCLLIFGAASIKDFALAMVVGVIFGTYSSIFVVAELVVEWEKAMPMRTRRI
jgi:preprotein translocase SecF subunit